jgi:hypothetical protein
MDTLRDPYMTARDGGICEGDRVAALAQKCPNLGFECTHLTRMTAVAQSILIAQRRAAFAGTRGDIRKI